ncbi:MAG: hypothetical protein GF411_04125 [Candidatus Lokiarchaeota archaeon]|nr:hypothetical protein [Candidatus Lokiarchaeota archaeon]
MAARKKTGIRKGLVLFTLAILLISSVIFPVSASTIPQESVAAKNQMTSKPLVHIYFDESSEKLIELKTSTLPYLINEGFLVETYQIDSFYFLKQYIQAYKPDYGIYYFDSATTGMNIDSKLISWALIAEVVEKNPLTEHIIGIGNARRIADHLDESSNLHVDDTDVIDVELTRLFALWTIADTMSESTEKGWATQGENFREVVIRDFADNVNEYFSKGLIPEEYTGERVPKPIKNPNLTQKWIEEEKQYSPEGEELEPVMKLGNLAQDEEYIPLREMLIDSGIGGPIGWLLDTVIGALIELGFHDLAIHEEAAGQIVDHFEDVVNESRYEVREWFIDEGFNVTGLDYGVHISDLLPRQLFEFWSMTDQLFLDAWYEVDDYIGEFFERVINTPVQTDLRGLVPVFLFRLGTPINLGSNFASFGAVLRVKLLPDFEIDKEPFKTFMNEAVLGDLALENMTDIEDAFTEVRKFIDIIPVMNIDFAICAFLPTGNDWAQGLMGQFTIEFFGHAFMELAFPPIDASNTDRSFIHVREWGFIFELDAEFSLSVSAFLAPGPGGVISTILEWFEKLLSVTIGLTLSIILEISKKYQGQGLPALSTLLFDIVIGVSLKIRILVAIFKGKLKVGLRFEQKSGILESEEFMRVAAEEPAVYHTLSEISTSTLGIYISLYASLYFGVDLFFTSFGTKFGGPWETTFDLSTSWDNSDYGTEAADLVDTDEDGLPDAFETTISTAYEETEGYILAADGPYLDPTSSDTDGDGLNDKLEIEINTAPNNVDTDEDMLSDYDEHITYLTDPLRNDTDRDNLTDYDEVIIYKTSPFNIDTDGDALHDWYEINTVYDITFTSGTYGAVEEVEIGGVIYNDRTDPLNPDTDQDNLLDGEEWENGVMYLNESELEWYQYAHYQYTHPLDSDTDDDSVAWQFTGNWNDPFEPTDDFIWELNDGIEVMGQIATIPDLEGYPEVKVVKTNPVYQDTDNDTAWGSVALYVTDGYELARDPQWDPTNGDQDSDGLKDGYELIGPGGTGTDAQNPDTDNDHLPDYEDYMLDTDPRNPDTDEDMVLDGDEYFIFGTNPLLNDSDFDGLSDGEELYFFYTNPLVRDSDLDGLTDGEEILIYLTDPLVNDTDNDLLKDGYEVEVSKTNPRLFDTDEDRLGDGEELLIYNSNPLDFDTDGDSLAYPNATLQMTLPLGDGAEVLDYHTSPIAIDTDSDGLTDAQEIYLSLGYPGADPIPLDPLNNDTDQDTIPDGMELVLKNVSIITFPYQALMIDYRYGSSPVSNDTDGDMLLDNLEIEYGTDPDIADSDNDNINDYNEIFVTFTDPLSNDTDGDEIPDNLESWENVTAVTPPPNTTIAPFAMADLNESVWPLYPTSATDSDTDNDLLPDGLELIYGTDPLDWDENGNGIADGYEYDYDSDGLSDAEEIYIEYTWKGPLPISNNSHGIWHWTRAPGGFDNPDSDGDGINDGAEVHTYGTDPTSSDSDNDGVSDLDEINMGGDPNVPITSGYPFWILATIIGGGAFVAGIVTVPIVRGVYEKVKDRKGTKTKSKKKSGKKKRKSKKKSSEGDTK